MLFHLTVSVGNIYLYNIASCHFGSPDTLFYHFINMFLDIAVLQLEIGEWNFVLKESCDT
jgi:hypothetical protein